MRDCLLSRPRVATFGGSLLPSFLVTSSDTASGQESVASPFPSPRARPAACYKTFRRRDSEMLLSPMQVNGGSLGLFRANGGQRGSLQYKP